MGVDNTLEAGKAIAKIISSRGQEVYLTGKKCHSVVHNSMHIPKIKTNVVELATSMPLDDLKNIFPRSEIRNSQLVINFANNDFAVNFFSSLDEFRKNRYFSINAILQNYDGEVIDYSFDFKGKTYYAFQDVKDKVIRIIGDPIEILSNKPMLIFHAFSLMAKYGYSIEKDTLDGIKSSLSGLKGIDRNYIGKWLRNIMTGKYSYAALVLMQSCRVFSSECNDGVIFKPFATADFSDIQALNKLGNSELESWAALIKEEDFDEIVKFNVFEEKELATVRWLIKNKSIFKTDDYVQAIHDSISDEERKYDIHHLKELCKKSTNLYLATSNDQDKQERAKKLYFWLCARPYFNNQIDINLEELKQIVKNEVTKDDLFKIREALLDKITFSKECPRRRDFYFNILEPYLQEEGYETIPEKIDELTAEQKAEEIEQ